MSILSSGGVELGRPQDEIAVTTDLIQPSTVGGILVALQQPRPDHPFKLGTENVIEDCPTLKALCEVFHAVSRGSLNLLRDISVIDLLPYTTEEDWNHMSDDEKQRIFELSQFAIGAKKPDVVLCAGKIRMPKSCWRVKGEMWKLESIGVGKVFPTNIPHIKLKDRYGSWINIRRVNGFHPSYALAHHPEYSPFRQLFFLVVVQACAFYSGTPLCDEEWMKELRLRCSCHPEYLSGERDLFRS